MERDAELWIGKIKELASEIDREITILTLCGTHENTVARAGIRSLMPENVKLVPGPGCPVCVIVDEEIAKFMHFLENVDSIVTCFGDVAKLPYRGRSLKSVNGKGKLHVVYSVFDALKLAEKVSKPVVHLAIGFETTMPSTALALLEAPENFYVLNAHRFFIPAISALLSRTARRVDALINPGHVSAIVGVIPYREVVKKFQVPQVISGFEPLDVVESIALLLEMLKEGKAEVINQYHRVVKEEGNEEALKLLDHVFTRDDAEWRGLGVIKHSKPVLKKEFEEKDAEKAFEGVFEDFVFEEDERKKACRCGDVLLANITPHECPLFGKVCTPSNPIGPCMVSIEGACNIWYGLASRKW